MRKFFSDKFQIKYIRKALKNPHLYNDEELIKLKTSLQKLLDEKERTRQITNRGFGYD
tara:strand:+ start:2308 stop:2481 length:174 start_codon:yes stop_codon:yes gene_type:complete